MSTTTTFTFPVAEIDPRTKDRKYILQHARAGYNTSKGLMPNSLYFGRLKLAENRSYAQGAQRIDKYKKQLLPDESTDETWQNIAWEVLPILPKFREIAVALLCQQAINVEVQAVDSLAKTLEDQYLNQMKVKIMMRQAAQQAGSELANSPLLKSNHNEPEDMEQLEMEMEFGYKDRMAQEAELAIQLARSNNTFEEVDKRLVENLIDYGIGGLTQWIDENGIVKEDSVEIDTLVMSYCRKKDFSDLKYWGRVTEVMVVDLAPYFTPSEMITLCNHAKGKYGNPTDFDFNQTSYYDPFKVYVLDYKFLDYDSIAYEERYDESDNMRFGKTKYGKINRIDASSEQLSNGQPVYMKSTKKVMRKCKWIIDTDYVYDYGVPETNYVSENMVRKQSCWWDTGLDLQLYAWNFEKMKFHGLTERLIPLADDIQMIWYKMQNLRNKMIPYIMTLDLTAFESVPFGKGGQSMKPIDAVDFLMSNFIAVWRSTDLLKSNPNYKPATVESTGDMAQLGQLKEDMYWKLDIMRQVSGLNELTDSSTPNAKTLVPVANAAITNTNNALWPIHSAHKYIVLKAAENIVLKQQIAVRLGKVEGLVKALGTDTLKMYQLNPDFSMREYGLSAKDAPTEAERQQLWQDVLTKENQGLIDVTDKELIMSCTNIRQATKQLAYRIKKRKEEAQRFELQKIQENNQGQQQMAMQAAQMQQQTIQMQLQADLTRIQAEKEWDYRITLAAKQIDYNAQEVQADARNIGKQIEAAAKITSTHIATEGAKDKQHIANKKPKPKAA